MLTDVIQRTSESLGPGRDACVCMKREKFVVVVVVD